MRYAAFDMLTYGQVRRQTGLTYGHVIRRTTGPTYGEEHTQ